MKKVFLLMAAALVASVAITGCKKPNNLDDVIEDGFYVVGDATGSAKIQTVYMMSAGKNENDGQKKRDGMYEKYVALEANKDFTLALYEAGNTTKYSATLTEVNTNGENDQPTVTIYKGVLVTGEDAPAMKVAANGLYHIVLDLNKANDLASAQIILAPVSWGVRGINGDWGWTEMTASAFNAQTMSWTIHYDNVNTCDFKFSYGGGWKIQLDDAGTVKANTNLGKDMEQGGDNIEIIKSDDVTITLTWTLASGELCKSYAYSFAAAKSYMTDPAAADFVVGISGGDNGWGDPADSFKAAYSASESNITDAKTYAGNYVFNFAGVTFANGFKFRINGGWFGLGDAGLEITGVNAETVDGNISIPAGTYSIKLSFDWNGAKASNAKAVFTAK